MTLLSRLDDKRSVDDLKDPPCPRMQLHDVFKRIEPVKPGHDERTFGCPRCLYVESLVVDFS